MTLTAERNMLPSPHLGGGVCMSGTIHYRSDVRRYFVRWWHEGKDYKIYKYEGQYLYDKRLANKLLACMQSDVEKKVFRIEKYLYQAVDVAPYLRSWLKEQKHLSPATYKDYQNSIENHLVPWFEKNRLMLHEIQYDVLVRLVNEIKREGKGKQNTMYCLHKCLDSAWKSGRIQSIPPFPEKNKYGIIEPEITWVNEERQMAIINAIPEIHRPIFLWLKYHLRRPSEAMALYKEDYDKETDTFTIRRTFSNKKLVNHTKTHKNHHIPCHPAFKPILETMDEHCISPFFFTNPTGKLEGKHYQHDFLVDLWHKACASVGETINMYSGLKHSSCSQLINECGLSVDEVQMLTDHSRRDSVLKYAEVKVAAKRNLMARVIKFRAGSGMVSESEKYNKNK